MSVRPTLGPIYDINWRRGPRPEPPQDGRGEADLTVQFRTVGERRHAMGKVGETIRQLPRGKEHHRCRQKEGNVTSLRGGRGI